MNSLLSWMLLGARVAQVWESNLGLALVQGSILSSLSSNVVSKMSCCQTVGGGGATKSRMSFSSHPFPSFHFFTCIIFFTFPSSLYNFLSLFLLFVCVYPPFLLIVINNSTDWSRNSILLGITRPISYSLQCS